MLARASAWPWTTIAIAVVSLWLPFANYGFSGDLIGGDASAAWALPGELLGQLLGVFVDYQGLGQNAAEGIQGIFPTLTFAAALHGVGLSTAIVARLMVALYYFVAISGAERACSVLLRNEPTWLRRTAALCGGLLYGVNHYTLHVFGTVETYFPLGYIAMPWLLFGVLEGCERDRRSGIAAIAAAVVCAGGAAMNPAFFGVALLVLPFGAALALAGGALPLRVLTVCAGGLALGLGLCAWWVLPAPTGFGASLGQLAAEGSASWVQWMSGHSGFEQLFRLDGYVGSADLPFARWYASPFGALLGYMPLLVAVAGAGVVRRRLGAVALLVFAVLVFLAKGVHAPFGGVYQALMDHVPGFSIFRSPYDKWAQLEALALVVVYVLGFAGLVRRLRAWRRSDVLIAVAAACAIVPVVAYPWPAFFGRMLQFSADPVVTFTTSIPGDYRRVGELLRRNSRGSRTLVLNSGGLPYPLYSWGYFGQDPLPVVAGVPVSGVDAIPRAAYLSTKSLERAMNELAVRFIVVHDDLRNPQPSADVGALVADGDARLVLRTRTLRLFERPNGPVSLASLIHDPALAARDISATQGGVDPLQTAQLVPNITPALGEVPPATVLAGASNVQPGDATLGSIATVTAGAPVQPLGRPALLLGNPLTAAVRSGQCGRREALHLRSPTRWTIGHAALATFDETFCLAHPHIGAVFVDGTPAEGGAGTVTFAQRPSHRMVVTEIARRVNVVALPVAGEDLVFHFVAPFAGDRIEVPAPAAVPGSILMAQVSTSDDSPFGTGFDDDGSASFVVPAVGRKPLPGEICFIDFHASDARLWPALRRLRSLPLTLEATKSERFAFSLDDTLLDAQALSRADLRGPVRARGSARRFDAAEPSRITWLASRTGATGAKQAVGSVLITDAYRLHVSYQATGDAALTLLVDGYSAARPVPLLTDGRSHVVDEPVLPPTASSGHFTMSASAVHGTLRVRGASLDDVGPNALIYAVRPARLGGRLLHAERRAAWRFGATVADCTPCALRIAVSEPRHWIVRGARVLGAYEAAGQSTGMPWSGNTTGAATWLIDAGPGEHDIEIVFYPALLAALGLALSLVALALGVLWLLRLQPGDVTSGEPASLRCSRRSELLRATTLVLAVAVAPSSAFAAFGDPAGAALWFTLVVLAVSLFFDAGTPSVVD